MMAASMPAVVVLIFCKTVIAGPDDQNSAFTGYQNRTWAIEHGQMICRRQEVNLYDISEAMGATPQPFNQWRCNMAGITLGAGHDYTHPSSAYRFYRSACPTPIVNERGEIVSWKIPDCGNGPGHGLMICESDTAI